MARLALIADIHANLEAFHAVLADVASMDVDRVVCLGDIVGYGPDPADCLELAFTTCDRIVLGNHDEAILRPELFDRFNPRAKDSLEYAASVLTDDHRARLATLPDRARVDGISLAHASFGVRPYEYLYDEDAAVRSLRGLRTRVGAVGHTHLPCIVSGEAGLAGAIENVRTTELIQNVQTRVFTGGVSIINPGSVGQPRDRNPDASWAVLDTDAMTVTLRRVAYDIDAVRSKMNALGLPDVLADRLLVGA